MRHLIIICCTLVLLGTPAVAAAESPDAEEAGQAVSVHDRWAVRGGLLFNGMFGGDDAEVMQYFDLGLRFKSGEYHAELRAPALGVLFDLLFMLAGWAVADVPEPLFERLNSSEPGYWELGQARLGYRFLLVPPWESGLWSGPVETAVGFFATAELIAFTDRRGVDFSEANSYGYDDPFVLGGGGFIAFGETDEHLQYDLALGVGRGIRGVDDNPDRSVTFLMADLDFQYAPGQSRFAWYVRPRLNTYVTRLSPSVTVTGALTAGLTVGF